MRPVPKIALLSALISTYLAPCPAIATELPFRVVSVSSAADINRFFTGDSEWIGADGNYSVPLSPTKTLWFFSDTWLGEIRDGKRQNGSMINNSVGLQTKTRGDRRTEFFWGKSIDGKASALFLPADDRGWFWPVGGVMARNRLYWLFWQMEAGPGTGGFGFRSVGNWLAEVPNPTDSPQEWRVTQKKLPFTAPAVSGNLLFGSAVMQFEGHVYIFGVEDREPKDADPRNMILARVEPSDIGNFDRWRFWSDSGWEADFSKRTPIAAGMATEYSVTYVPAIKQFLAVCNDTKLSPTIVARAAPKPWGPWSSPLSLHKCEEASWNPNIFCYSGKAHASLSSPDELVISYAANSKQLADVINDARLYWPKFIRVKVAPTDGASKR